MDNAEQMIATICSETGKTFEDASLAEISYAGNAFGFWAKHAAEYLADERVKSSQLLVKGKKLDAAPPPARADRRDRPVELSADELVRRLHPSVDGRQQRDPEAVGGDAADVDADGRRAARVRHFPTTSSRLRPAAAPTGAALIEQVDMIMFTGSTRTGRKVAEAAGRRLIPASLELGGKDPMIVLSDADLERAANFATYYSMQNAGQTCISIERVYVEAPVYDEFVEKVSGKVRAAARRQAERAGLGRGRRDHVPAAAADDRRPRDRRRRQGRARARRRPRRRAGRAGASTSRPCSSTSITR